jgi:hypothetical protein
LPYDKDRIKEELTLAEIKSIMQDLGSEAPKIIGNMLAFQTICHGGHKHKLFYYPDSFSFHCYTDCGETFDIYDLVIRVNQQQGRDFSFYEAVSYVADFTGKNYQLNHYFTDRQSFVVNDLDWLNKFKKKPKTDIHLPVYNETVLDVFLHLPHQNWLDDGISYEVMMKYGICYYVKENAIVIPVRNQQGQLIGIRRRALEKDEIESGKKYMPLSVAGKIYSYPALFNLYGLYENQETIERLKKCLIFESEKSVMKVESFYPGNNFTVATCNSNLSTWQRDTILELGVEEVFLAYDKEFDDATSDKAEKYKNKLLRLAQMFTPYVRTYIIWDQDGLLEIKNAPCDKGQTIFEKLLMEKYEINTMEGEEN